VQVEYREDALATIVSGLVLGCLLALLPDHHPVLVAVQNSKFGPYLPSRRRGPHQDGTQLTRGWRSQKGSHKAVEQSGATGNRTFPTAMTVWNLGQSPCVLGLQAVLNGGGIAFLPGVGRE
jgi:hypothetical protein